MIAPGGVSNDLMYTIPALMWLVGRLAKRHTVKVYLLHRAAAPTRENVLGVEVMNDGGALRHLRVIQAIRADHGRAPFDLVHSIWAGTVGLVGALAAWRIETTAARIATAAGDDDLARECRQRAAGVSPDAVFTHHLHQHALTQPTVSDAQPAAREGAPNGIEDGTAGEHQIGTLGTDAGIGDAILVA